MTTKPLTRRDKVALAAADACRGAGDFRRTTCPFCPERMGSDDPHSAFWVSQVAGWYGCWRCGVKGRLPGFDDDAQYIPEPTAPEDIQRAVGQPEYYEPLLEVTPSTRQPIRYLSSRGITRSTVVDAKIGVCLRGDCAGRVVVPCLAIDGHTWLGWSARLYREPKGGWERNYKTAPGMDRANLVYNLRALAGNSQTPVMCCEGVFDALPYFPHAVALLGKPGAGQEALLAASKRQLVVCLDGDSWREAQVLARRLRRLGKLDVGWVRLPAKQDPNTVDRAVLRAAVATAARDGESEYEAHATKEP